MGPNCAGLINLLDPKRPFAGTFFKDLPFRGVDPQKPGIALVSQSGAIAEEVIASSHTLGIPLGCVVSVGNGMHLGLADFIAGIAENPYCNVDPVLRRVRRRPRSLHQRSARNLQAQTDRRTDRRYHTGRRSGGGAPYGIAGVERRGS